VKVALVTNFWYLRGGLEAVMFAERDGLDARGHETAGFAAAHPLNEAAAYADLFPAVTEHGDVGRGMSPGAKAVATVRQFANLDAARAFGRFIDAFQPDVVHQHGTSRQLSPSVLELAARRGVPTVMTIHDYSLRCPAGTLSRIGEPECVTVSCAGHRYDRAVRFRCVHGSRAASALAATELLVARALRRYERAVDTFVVPSDYLGMRMRESGLPARRLHVLPNAIADGAPSPQPASRASSILVIGRLVPTKGFDVVIEAARVRPDIRWVIAGDGPERGALEQRAVGLDNVTFAGHLDAHGLSRRLADARAVAVPSTWPEPFGMVVLEAWRAGRPVIVSDRGALPDIVRDGLDGIVVEPGDPEALVAAA
jgi:glycosyltransferase involved in cell wall biosynthesis